MSNIRNPRGLHRDAWKSSAVYLVVEGVVSVPQEI